MSKLSNFAARAPQILKDLDAQADELSPSLDKLEKTGQDVFTRWKTHIAETSAAIATAQNAINQLSNGAPPLSDSPLTVFATPAPPATGGSGTSAAK